MKRKRNDGDNRGYTLDALARKMERNAEADDFRQAHCKKRLAFTGAAMRLDDCLQDENGDERESSLLSDNGRGAESMLSAIDGERGESAAWLCEFRRAVATRMTSFVSAFCTATGITPGSCSSAAARLAATNRQRVYRTIAKLREVLAPAHELWERRFD